MSIDTEIVEQFSVNSVINGSPSAMAIYGPDLRIIAFNDVMEVLCGFSIDEARGVPCRYIVRGNLCIKGCPARQALKDPFILLYRHRMSWRVLLRACPIWREPVTLGGGITMQ